MKLWFPCPAARTGWRGELTSSRSESGTHYLVRWQAMSTHGSTLTGRDERDGPAHSYLTPSLKDSSSATCGPIRACASTRGSLGVTSRTTVPPACSCAFEPDRFESHSGLRQRQGPLVADFVDEVRLALSRPLNVVFGRRSSRMRESAAGFGCKTDIGALSRTKASFMRA